MDFDEMEIRKKKKKKNKHRILKLVTVGQTQA